MDFKGNTHATPPLNQKTKQDEKSEHSRRERTSPLDLEASRTRRDEYADGSLLCVNEIGAHSRNAEMRRL